MTSIQNSGLHQEILPDVHHSRRGKRQNPSLSEKAEMVHDQINQGLEHLSGRSLTREDFEPMSDLSELLDQVTERTISDNQYWFSKFYSNLKKELFRPRGRPPRGRQHPLATQEQEKKWRSLYIAACFISVFDFLINRETYRKNLTDVSRFVVFVNYIVEFCFQSRGIDSLRIYDALGAVPTILAKPTESSGRRKEIARIVEGNIAWEKIKFDNSPQFFPFPLIVNTLRCSSSMNITVEEICRAMGFSSGDVLNVFGKDDLQNQLLGDNGWTAVQMKVPTSQADHFRADSSFQRNNLLMGHQSNSNISPVGNTVPVVEGCHQPSGAPCVQEVQTHASGIYPNSRYVEAYNAHQIWRRTDWLYHPWYSYPCNSQPFVPPTFSVASTTEGTNTQVSNNATAAGVCSEPARLLGYHKNPSIDTLGNDRHFETLDELPPQPQRYALQAVGYLGQENSPQRLGRNSAVQEGHTSFILEKSPESWLLSQPLRCTDHNFTLGNTMQDSSSFSCRGRSTNRDESMHGEQFSRIGEFLSASMDGGRRHQW